MSAPTQPSRTAHPSRSWEARPVAARAIRTVVVLGPISVGCVAAILTNRWLGMPTTRLVAVGRSVLIVVISTLTVWGVDRFARKLLPLAALMQLSLVFPDQAPSRFRSALKSGSSRRLERTLDETRKNGLAKDPGDAARQVVQLIGAIGDHDRRTRGHSERVRLFADLVGEELKLSKEERQKLQWGALLHDLGKLMVPSEILNKDGKPDDDEWRILQGHPAAGMELIEPLRDFLGEWVHAIGGHHEKWNGTGYPAGLQGERIPRSAAIVAVADSFEVMTSVRSYKKAMPLAEARAELTRCAGQHFSPEVVRAFLNISLGHLRLVSGPLAALAHLPFLGNLAQLPAAAAAAPTMIGAAALPAAMVTAAALTIGSPARVAAVELVQTQDQQAVAPAPAPDSTHVDDLGSMATSAAAISTTTSSVPDNAAVVPDAATAAGEAIPADTTTTSTSSPTPTPAPPAPMPTVPAATPAPTTTLPTTTVAPVTTAPTTAAAPTTTAASAPAAFGLVYSTNSSRTGALTLDGATVARGSRIYVVAVVNAWDVAFSYPGGSHSEDNAPYDMLGTRGDGTATSYTVPWTPGTYTISAEAVRGGSGQTWRATVNATFTVV